MKHLDEAWFSASDQSKMPLSLRLSATSPEVSKVTDPDN